MPRPQRLLITGGAGFIGTNLVERLGPSPDFDITVVDTAAPSGAAMPASWGGRYCRTDIRDQTAMAAALSGVDVVVHLAADTRVIDSINDPEQNFDVNVVGTFHVLSLARAAGVRRFINASTGGAILGEVAPPVHEGMVPNPNSPYGASKLAAEGYCSAFAGAYGLSTLSLRFSNVYGPHSLGKASVVAAFIKNILARDDLVVYGDGTQVRDYLFVDDLVDGVVAALESDQRGVLQLGSGIGTSLNQLISSIREAAGPEHDIRVRHEPFRKGEIRNTWCDISEARRRLGFEPRTPLTDGLAATWLWFVDRAEAVRSGAGN